MAFTGKKNPFRVRSVSGKRIRLGRAYQARKIRFGRFVSGHDFSRADKPFIFSRVGFSRRQDTGRKGFPQPVNAS